MIDINDISAIDHTPKLYVPALFCVVKGDSFIANKHSELLHGSYAGAKFILSVEGDHNDARPPAMHVFVRRFLERYMQVPTSWALEKRESVFSTLPPWHPTHGRVLPSEGPSHDLLNLEEPHELWAVVSTSPSESTIPSPVPSTLQPTWVLLLARHES